MDLDQAKRMTRLLAREWDIKSALHWSKMFNDLEDARTASHSSFRTFEFSFKTSTNAIRPLHLSFYKQNISPLTLEKIKKKRVDTIRQIILDDKKYNYKIAALNQLSSLTCGKSWPIQFGLDARMNTPPVFKIYASITDNHARAKELVVDLCAFLSIDWDKISDIFSDQKYDAVGIDLSHTGICALKIYTVVQLPLTYIPLKTLLQKHQRVKTPHLEAYLNWIEKIPLNHIGFLYRISSGSTIHSVKIWARLSQTTHLSNLTTPHFKNSEMRTWWMEITGIIKEIGCGVSYLTFENNTWEVYCR